MTDDNFVSPEECMIDHETYTWKGDIKAGICVSICKKCYEAIASLKTVNEDIIKSQLECDFKND